MKTKLVGIVVLMLVATSVVSATKINMNETIQTKASGDVSYCNNHIVNYQPISFDWGVDQKQTHTDGYGITLYPPDTNAQSFTPTKDKLTAVSLYLFKYGTPPEPVQITVSIRDNLSGSDLATKTIDTSVVTISSKATWVLFDFEDISITPGSKYFIVCSGSAGTATNAYCWLFAKNDTYTRGEAWYKANAVSSWIKWPSGPTNPTDFCFKTYFRKPLDISIPKDNVMTLPGNPLVQSCPLIRMALRTTTDPAVGSLKDSAIHTGISRHPITSMAGSWRETQKLTYPGAKTDYFGCAVAVDGDTALISAPAADGWNGSVYMYTRTGATWTQQQKLTPSDPGVDDCFGVSVAVNGDTALIGADDEFSLDNSGAVYVFTRTSTTWTQQQKLTPSDGAAGDMFGLSVSLSGNTALIGAWYDDDNGNASGSAYIFTSTGTTWTQQAKLLASDGIAGDFFGYRVSLDGDTALIGEPALADDPDNPGSAYVFTRTGTTWTQQAKLRGSDSVPGDSFGDSVCLEGDTAFVGAGNDDDQGLSSGSAFVFTRTGTTWTQQQKLLASDGTAWDWFGGSGVSLNGDTALIGAADDEDNGAGSGSAYIFTRTGTTWTQQQHLLASDGKPNDNFGWPVCLNGDTAFIGAYYDITHGVNSGSVYVFTKNSLTFSITGGLGVKTVIKNNGTSDANGVTWQIHVKGGILGMINKTMNGTIDILAGETKTVGNVMVFGFGPITITAKVAGEEQTATGTQIIIFSMVK